MFIVFQLMNGVQALEDMLEELSDGESSTIV